MNIRGLPREIRQSSRLLGQPRKLIFAYPILIDESLIQLSGLLREFIAISFIGEIRISNILNVSTKYLSPINNSSNVNQLTPAERLYNNLRPDNINPQVDNNVSDYYRASQMRQGHYMNEFIANELNIIKQHIKNNSRYNKLKPSISVLTIVGDEFVNIPLIIGTKMYPVNPANLYWILLIAIGFNISLDKVSNIERISNIIKNINPSYFYNLIFTDVGRNFILNKIRAPNSIQYKQKTMTLLLKSVFDGMKRTKVFFNTVLQASNWDMYNGLTSYTTPSSMFTTAQTAVSPQMSKIMVEATQLFYTFISNEVANIIHSYSNLYEPLIADPSIVINRFIDKLHKNVLAYDDITTLIYSEVHKSLKSTSSNESPHIAIDRLSKICQTVNKMDVYSIFKSLTNCSIIFTFKEMHNFLNSVEYMATRCNSLSKSLEETLITLSGTKENELKSKLRQCKQSIINACDMLINGQNQLHGSLFEPVETGNSHAHFSDINGHPAFTPLSIHNDELYAKLLQTSIDSVNIISNIIYFLYLFIYISFICKSVNILKLEINVIRRDATDFPNYILIIPMEILQTLHSIIHIRNFNAILKSPEEQRHLFDNANQWSANQSQLQKMIFYIKKTLEIPNIIVIDQKTKELYYNFMYMHDTAKIRLSSVQTYIQNQSNILNV